MSDSRVGVAGWEHSELVGDTSSQSIASHASGIGLQQQKGGHLASSGGHHDIDDSSGQMEVQGVEGLGSYKRGRGGQSGASVVPVRQMGHQKPLPPGAGDAPQQRNGGHRHGRGSMPGPKSRPKQPRAPAAVHKAPQHVCWSDEQGYPLAQVRQPAPPGVFKMSHSMLRCGEALPAAVAAGRLTVGGCVRSCNPLPGNALAHALVRSPCRRCTTAIACTTAETTCLKIRMIGGHAV